MIYNEVNLALTYPPIKNMNTFNTINIGLDEILHLLKIDFHTSRRVREVLYIGGVLSELESMDVETKLGGTVADIMHNLILVGFKDKICPTLMFDMCRKVYK